MAISIPEKQKAACVDKPGKDAKAVIREIPVEEPQEGEVLIKLEATGGSCLRDGTEYSMSYRFAFAKR